MSGGEGDAFVEDTVGYRRWLDGHPDGCVVNTTRPPRPEYLILHRATCAKVGTLEIPRHQAPEYTRLCFTDLKRAEAWARLLGGPLVPCLVCMPPAPVGPEGPNRRAKPLDSR